MARITKQDVWRVADEINAVGKKPTVIEIRSRLGAGSYTTITSALREWVRPAGDDDAVTQSDTPQDVLDRVEQFAADLYAIALKSAKSEFDDYRKELDQRIKDLEFERNEAVQVADECEEELTVLRASVLSLSDELASFRVEVARLKERESVHEMERQRALLEAVTARDEAGVLRGKLEVYESRSRPAPSKSSVKATKPKSSPSVLPNTAEDQQHTLDGAAARTDG